MKKEFDCMSMKNGIQKRMLKQMEGLSSEQQRMVVRDALEESQSSIGELWRALGNKARSSANCVAETIEAYGGGTGGTRNKEIEGVGK